MARQARPTKAGLPPELPVMAALVESGVRNLNYGDADSVGFFQMRPSIWNRASTPATARTRACRRSGSSTTRSRTRAADRRGGRGLRQGPGAAGASGSPTSSGPPSSTAAATSCASRRRAGCCADQSSPPPTLIGSLFCGSGRRGRRASAPGRRGPSPSSGRPCPCPCRCPPRGSTVPRGAGAVGRRVGLGFGTLSAGGLALAAATPDATFAGWTSITSGPAGAAAACASASDRHRPCRRRRTPLRSEDGGDGDDGELPGLHCRVRTFPRLCALVNVVPG